MSPYLTTPGTFISRKTKQLNATKLTDVSGTNKGETDWLFFAMPIIITLVIFIFIISWIWLKKQGHESWKDIMNCRRQQEGNNEETAESFNNESYGEIITVDVNTSRDSPTDEEMKPPFWLMGRTRSSCPPMNNFSVKRESSLHEEENSLNEQEPFYAHVDYSKVKVIKNTRPFRSENDLKFLQVSTGTSFENFKLSLQRINLSLDLDKDKFSSYVILEGSEYKVPSSVPKYDAPSMKPPGIPANGSFLEINLSDCQTHIPHITSFKQKELPKAPTELSNLTVHDCEPFPIYKELPKPPTELPEINFPDVEPFQIHKELPKSPTDLPEINVRHGEPFEGHKKHGISTKSFRQKELPKSPTGLTEMYISDGDHFQVELSDYEPLHVAGKHTYADTRGLGQSNFEQSTYDKLTVYETEPYLNLLQNDLNTTGIQT